MTLESSVSFFIAVFVFSVTPGPGVLAIISRALIQGARSCFWLSFGMVASDVLYLIAACFGLAAIAENWSELFFIIRVLGALYLLYLGWKLWHAEINLEDRAQISGLNRGAKAIGQGFLISASNPKVILFYIAFLPTFIDLTLLETADIALVSVLALISLMSGLTLVAVFASAARNLIGTGHGAKRLNQTSGTVMMGAGAFLLLKS